jgi:hypothetical protein
MASSDVLVDAFERIRDALHPAVNDLSAEQLAFRPDGESNSIGWLVWHLTRIQDDHVAGLHGGEQVWKAGGGRSGSRSPSNPPTPATATGPRMWPRSPPTPHYSSATSKRSTRIRWRTCAPSPTLTSSG